MLGEVIVLVGLLSQRRFVFFIYNLTFRLRWLLSVIVVYEVFGIIDICYNIESKNYILI